MHCVWHGLGGHGCKEHAYYWQEVYHTALHSAVWEEAIPVRYIGSEVTSAVSPQ